MELSDRPDGLEKSGKFAAVDTIAANIGPEARRGAASSLTGAAPHGHGLIIPAGR
jgi:hypothetical protein